MGREVANQLFKAADFQRFNRIIHQQLEELAAVIRQPTFGQEPISIGAELEVNLMGTDYQISPVNLQMLERLADPQFQTELNQYNLELNLSPVLAQGKPFSAITREIVDKFVHARDCGKQLKTQPVAIGILPTLQKKHLADDYMTVTGRYQLLAKAMKQMRGEPFHIKIDGDEPIDFHTVDIGAEGANTSFQVHLMTPVERFVDTFNAVQLTTPVAIAIAANSGVFLGRCAWDETRVALFKQAVDHRKPNQSRWQQPSRVYFGHGWLRKSPWELFAQAVNLYQPVMPVFFPEDTGGSPPELAELNFHMGTTWPWTRAIYSHHGNGHLRIEFRALPSGPTAVDMTANAAFSIGMAMGMQNQVDHYLTRLPFDYAIYNFYRAAKDGLNATLLWPQRWQNQPVEMKVSRVIEQMLPIADEGLSQLNVARTDRDKFLGIIEKRLAGGETGGSWAKKTLCKLRESHSNEVACQQLLKIYYDHQVQGMPLADWDRIWTL